MKRHEPGTSTTDTLSPWKPAGSEAALTVSVAVVSLSAHVVLHVSVLAGLVVAVALLRSRTLITAGLGVLYGVLICVPLKGERTSDYFTRALANLTNAMASRPLVPLASTTEPGAPPQDSAAAPVPASAAAQDSLLSPLPPATHAARETEEHIFWQFVHERMPASVPPMSRGRHARPGADARSVADYFTEHSPFGKPEPEMTDIPADEYAPAGA